MSGKLNGIAILALLLLATQLTGCAGNEKSFAKDQQHRDIRPSQKYEQTWVAAESRARQDYGSRASAARAAQIKSTAQQPGERSSNNLQHTQPKSSSGMGALGGLAVMVAGNTVSKMFSGNKASGAKPDPKKAAAAKPGAKPTAGAKPGSQQAMILPIVDGKAVRNIEITPGEQIIICRDDRGLTIEEKNLNEILTKAGEKK